MLEGANSKAVRVDEDATLRGEVHRWSDLGDVEQLLSGGTSGHDQMVPGWRPREGQIKAEVPCLLTEKSRVGKVVPAGNGRLAQVMDFDNGHPVVVVELKEPT